MNPADIVNACIACTVQRKIEEVVDAFIGGVVHGATLARMSTTTDELLDGLRSRMCPDHFFLYVQLQAQAGGAT